MRMGSCLGCFFVGLFFGLRGLFFLDEGFFNVGFIVMMIFAVVSLFIPSETKPKNEVVK